MPKIEIYETMTIGGQNFFKGDVHDESELGPGTKGYRARKLIGPVTEKTKAAMKAAEIATERPERDKEPKADEQPDQTASGDTVPDGAQDDGDNEPSDTTDDDSDKETTGETDSPKDEE